MQNWHAQIVFGGEKQHLGVFNDEKEAAAKYNEFALAHFGEHACLSEISSDEEEYDDDETDASQTP